MRRHHQKGMFENLESRHLLAADLVVDMEAPSSLVPGEFASYKISVTNEGDEVASTAEILSDPSDLLSDVSWSRETTFKPELNQSDLSRHMVTVEGLGGITDGTGIGDINNDGIDDVFFFGDGIGSYVVFGSEETSAAPVLSTRGLDGTNGFTLWNIGARVAEAVSGDINGDGNPDLVFGIPSHNPQENGGSEGAVFVIFGTGSVFPDWTDFQSLDETTMMVITGEVADQRRFGYLPASGLGRSLDIADLNADGIDDVIIAAAGSKTENFDIIVGGTHVVFGSTDLPAQLGVEELNGTNGFTIDGRTLGVSAAGDVNGDGIDDLVHHSESSTAVVHGGADVAEERSGFGLSTVFYEFVSVSHSSDGLGDINGDGLDDIVVGTPLNTSTGYFENGGAHVIFGFRGAPTFGESIAAGESITLDGNNGFSLIHQASDFGSFVRGAGDVDGDGVGDILLAAGSNPVQRGTDEFWLIYGKQDFPAEFTIDELSAADGVRLDFGSRVRLDVAGDFNNDGLHDLIVNDGSQAHILFGQPRPDMDLTEGQSSISEMLDIQPGTSVTYTASGRVRSEVAGDVEIAATATVDNEATENNADNRLIRGRRNVDLAVSALTTPNVGVDRTLDVEFIVTNGSKLAAVDSVISSNLTEVLVEPTWTRTIERPTQVAILSDLVDTTDGFQIGDEVRSAGDVNGDDLADLILENSIIFGTRELLEEFPIRDRASVVTFEGDFGANCTSGGPQIPKGSSAGDVNGDGFDDVLILGDKCGPSHTYLIFGSASFATEQLDLRELDPTTGFLFEGAVSPLGDRDGDGFDDLAVSVNYEPATILYGNPEFDPETAGSTSVQLEFSGILSMTNVGDVNGDGIEDSVVGGWYDVYSNAFLLLGNSERPSSIRTDEMDLLIDGSGDSFASAISDVNGDGANDFVVGFDFEGPDLENFPGTVTLFLGSQNAKTEGFELVTLTGGRSRYRRDLVEPIGDVNGDGFDDVPIFKHDAGLFSHRVLIGSADIASLQGSFIPALDSDMVLQSEHTPRAIGDFNGDGAQDMIVGQFLKLGQFDATESSGVGDIDDTIDIGIGSRVTYRISGAMRSEVPDGTLPVSLKVAAGDSRTDVAPSNNTASVMLEAPTVTLGDVNGDSIVSFKDFLILSANFGNTSATREDGDLDGDGEVSFSDFLVLSENYQTAR